MNAIILAAGMGTRLRPLTNEIPKCLVPVNGVPMVERQIRFLQEAGIHDITLVSGYKAEKLEFLREKFGVDIVPNPYYETCNNISSLYAARDRFSDTYMIEGDVFMDANCFDAQINRSTYFSSWKNEPVNEWGLKVDEQNNLESVEIGRVTGYVMSGISYWTAADCKKILSKMDEIMATRDYKELFWDSIVVEICHSLDICVKGFNDIYEIDTEKELRALEAYLNRNGRV